MIIMTMKTIMMIITVTMVIFNNDNNNDDNDNNNNSSHDIYIYIYIICVYMYMKPTFLQLAVSFMTGLLGRHFSTSEVNELMEQYRPVLSND